jgi:RNA polymerase sigma factor (sigma-70 family)
MRPVNTFSLAQTTRRSSDGGAVARLGAVARDHHAALVRFARRAGLTSDEAEDVAQTAFLVTLRALPRIAEGRERAFLFASATRVASGTRRKARRESPSEDLDLDPSPQILPDELVHQSRFCARVEALLDGIECRTRTVFTLFELDGLTIPEICAAMAISPNTVRVHLRRARKELRAAPASRAYETQM